MLWTCEKRPTTMWKETYNHMTRVQRIRKKRLIHMSTYKHVKREVFTGEKQPMKMWKETYRHVSRDLWTCEKRRMNMWRETCTHTHTHTHTHKHTHIYPSGRDCDKSKMRCTKSGNNAAAAETCPNRACCAYIHKQKYMITHTHIHTHAHTYTNTRTHTHTHTSTHIRTHTHAY